MPLYLHCVHLQPQAGARPSLERELGHDAAPAGSTVDHPAVRDARVCTCPGCCAKHSDWQRRALAALGV